MSDSVGRAYLTLVPKMQSGWKSSINAEVGSFASKSGESSGKKHGKSTGLAYVKSFKLAVGALAGSAVVGAMAEFGKAAIDNFATYEQVAGGAKLMFGDGYDYIAEHARSAYKDLQMSQNDYLTQVNGLAVGLKTALGGNEQAAAELAHNVVKAEADVVSATGAQREAVENAFNGIMKNNFSMVDNLGLGINATKEGFSEMVDSVNAYNKAHGNATNYQMGNVADMQSALIDYVKMQGMADYAADEGATTLEGATASMEASWSNLMTSLVSGGDEDIESAVNAFFDTAGNLIVLLVPKIGTLVLSCLKAIGMSIEKGLEWVWAIVREYVGGFFDSAREMFAQLGDDIGGAFSDTFGRIPEAIAGGLDAAIGAVTGWAGELRQGAIRAVAAFVHGIASRINGVKKGIEDGLRNARKAVTDFRDRFVEGGKNIIKGLVQGIKDGKQWVIDKVKELCRNAEKALKDFFGIHSPSTLARKLGVFIPQGFGLGITDGVPFVKRAMSAMRDVVAPTPFSVSPKINAGAYGAPAMSAAAGGVTVNVTCAATDPAAVAREINYQMNHWIRAGV